MDGLGQTYKEEDLNDVNPSNLIWTKIAIAESKGVSLTDMKKYANHFLKRISYANGMEAGDQEKVGEAIEKATSLYDVIKAIISSGYGQSISSTYDAELEKVLSGIDLTTLYGQLDQAVEALANTKKYTPEKIKVLQETKDSVANKLASKEYSADQVAAWQTEVQTALNNLEIHEQPLKSAFSIDAGRKYFSLDQLKALVDKASKNGYTDVQLILGNDGLRFILDDMSLSVNGENYKHDQVSKAIQKGNNAYYDDPNGNALTQNEMDNLLAFAKERNISIIAAINSPGHMDAILVAMEDLDIKNSAFGGSKRTVDLENQKAVNFTKALITKYVQYFAKHSKIFNFGGDEYANDVGTGGWAKLQVSGLYEDFVTYANDLSKIIKEAGMQPMCFNDGIYYNSDDSFGTFDPDIIISFWTAGWRGYDVAKPDYFIQKGHKIFNTNDGWYWVAGNVNSGIYKYKNALTNMSNIAFTDVPAGTGDIPIIGSIQCVWYDNPNKDHDFDKIYKLMDTFSGVYQDYKNKNVE